MVRRAFSRTSCMVSVRLDDTSIMRTSGQTDWTLEPHSGWSGPLRSVYIIDVASARSSPAAHFVTGGGASRVGSYVVAPRRSVGADPRTRGFCRSLLKVTTRAGLKVRRVVDARHRTTQRGRVTSVERV